MRQLGDEQQDIRHPDFAVEVEVGHAAGRIVGTHALDEGHEVHDSHPAVAVDVAEENRRGLTLELVGPHVHDDRDPAAGVAGRAICEARVAVEVGVGKIRDRVVVSGIDAGRAGREAEVAVVGIDEQRVGIDVADTGEAALYVRVAERDGRRIVVPDLEKGITFYQQLLGLTELNRLQWDQSNERVVDVIDLEDSAAKRSESVRPK